MKNLWTKFWQWDGLAGRNEKGFVQAALAAAPWILKGLSAMGGLVGKKRKYMSPEMAHQKYGPAAIAQRTQELMAQILNSPYGQELLTGAAQAGQGFERDVAAKAAESGMSPDTGAASGASIFSGAASGQASNVLRNQAKTSVWQSALPEAQRELANEQALEQGQIAGQNADPSMFQKIAAGAGAASDVWTPKPSPSATMVAPASPTVVRKPGEEDEEFVGGRRRPAARGF